MKCSRPVLPPLPPRLAMDEYAGFIEASLRGLSAGRVARQKALEELILAPFSMAERARKNSKKNRFH